MIVKGIRPSRETMMIEIANIVSSRGTCCRLKVGAVISFMGRVVSTGYNGSRPGRAHCTPETCNNDNPCTNTIHAEVNAIEFARQLGVDDFTRMEIYINHSPCINCAKEIAKLKFKHVYYLHEYRLKDGIECLKSNNIPVTRLSVE